MLSVFPEGTEKFDEVAEETIQQNELPVFKEYKIDFKTGQMIYKDGENVIVEENEALKIWIWTVLQVTKNKYKIYSNEYGNEFDNVIGKGYSKELIDTEIQRYVEECLLVNPYIKSVENVNIEFEGSKLTIKVKIKSIYGKVEVDV